jgi:2-polyprenyl-3-methyl-5-hydroxy-6-metoxy-1,4-benzoquinol methylase
MHEQEYEMLLTSPEVKLGVMTAHGYVTDPKRLAFQFARYKFVAKMLAGKESVLEIGCGDGFASRVVRQAVGRLVATDPEPEFINRASSLEPFPIEFKQHDMLTNNLGGDFDAAFALDVMEHIEPANEHEFVENVAASLNQHGVVIIGTPSVESQKYASALSRNCHVNCMNAENLKKLWQRRFSNVFNFSMNDEVVHTGFSPMAQYLFVLCTNKISS